MRRSIFHAVAAAGCILHVSAVDDSISSATEYSLEEVKYPQSRIELKDLNFCDLGWSGMTRFETKYMGSIECPPPWSENNLKGAVSDPTCMKCISPDHLKKGDEIWQRYSDEESKRERRAMFQQDFFDKQVCGEGDDPFCGNVAMLVAADDGYLPVLRHWWCHASHHGLQKTEVIIYAFGTSVIEWAEEEGMFWIEPSLYDIEVPKSVGFTFKYSLFPVFLDIMEMGKHVIFNDVDMVWTNNMLRVLPQIWPEVDLICQMAPIENFLGLNSGVLSLRPSRELIVFVETMMSIIPVFMERYGWGGDQILWNHLLRHHAFRSLTWRPLPHRVMLRHSLSAEYTEGVTLAVHFIGATGGKTGKMTEKMNGGWSEILSGSCLSEFGHR